MKKRRIMSLLLSLAMTTVSVNTLFVFSAVTAFAQDRVFIEDFSKYTSENAVVERYSLYNGKTTLATNGNASWTTSSVWVGNDSNNPTADRGFTYIDPINNKLYLQGRYGGAVTESRYASVNLEFKDTKFESVDQAKANISRNGTRMSSLRLFVSEDEKTYFEFGVKGNEQIGSTSNGNIEDGLNDNQPFIRVGTGTNTLTTVLKVGDEGTSIGDVEWSNTSSAVEWDISVNSAENTITFKCTEPVSGAYWEGSFEDTYGIIDSGWKYPAAFAVTGDGEQASACLNSINVWYATEDIADFTEDFSSYTTENSVTEKYSLYNGKKILAANGSASWVTSSVWIGNSSTSPTADKGFAYIDAENNRLHLQGRWGGAVSESRYAAANLSFENTNFESLNRVNAVLTRNGTRMSSIRLFVSEDEKTYFEFGAKNNEQIGSAANGNIEDGLNNFQPFIRVGTGTNTLTTVLKVGDEGTNIGDVEWTYSAGTLLEWDIKIKGTVISFKCTNLSTGAYWTGSFTDTYGVVNSEWKYPVAFAATGDGETAPAYLESVKLWSTRLSADECVFSDSFDSYAESDCPGYGVENAITARTCLPQVIAKNDNAVWVLSSVFGGNVTENPHYGQAAYDNETQSLYVKDTWQSGTTVNLLTDDIYKAKTIKCTGSGSRGGFRFLISDDELSYYELSYGRQSSNADDRIMEKTPYFKKVCDHEEIYFSTDDTAWTTTTNTARSYLVTFEENIIKWTVTAGDESWSGSFEDDELPKMMKNYGYIFAGYAFGDGAGYIDNIEIYGSKVKDITVENDTDYSVNIQPKLYDVTSDKITVMGVYTDADGTVTNVNKAVTNLSDETVLSFEKGTESGFNAYLFDGEASEGKLLNYTRKYDGTVPQYPISENPIKVACIGDSLTEGSGVSNKTLYSYPGWLRRQLGGDYEVKNFGLGGRTLMNSGRLPYMNEQYFIDSQDYQPDIVTIMLGTNDRNRDFANSGVSEEFYNDYKTLITTYQNLESKPEVILFIPPVAGTAENPNTSIPEYIAPLIKRVGKDMGCRVVNIHELVPDYELLTDTVHFGLEGYRELSYHFYDAITNKYPKINYTDTSVTVVPQSAFSAKVYAASYDNNGKLIAVDDYDSAYYDCSHENIIDISTLDKTGADKVKLFFWNDSQSSVIKASTNYIDNVINENGILTVRGYCADDICPIVVYDADGNVVYAESTKTDYNGNYVISVSGLGDNLTVKANSMTVY